MAALFAGNQDAHGTHGIPTWDESKNKWAIKSTAFTVSARTVRSNDMGYCVTSAHWAAHLAGTRPLGIVPIRADNTCVFGVGDIDEYDLDALALVARIEQLKYPLVPCRSKSGGLHLFLFLREPEPAAAVQACVRDMMASLGHASAEVFPKQTALVHERDQGNWMVMPYFGGDFEGKLQMQFGLKKGGGDMTLGEFLRAAEAARTSTAEVRIARGGGPRHRGKTNGHHPPAEPFADGPPCLQHLASTKVQKGGQDSALFMMGLYYKRAFPDDWRARLEAANRDFLETPGDAQFVLDKAKSLERKDYEYTCKTEPMHSFCNAALCRTRKYGIGETDRYPHLSGLVKYDSNPPLWFVDVGVEAADVQGDEKPPRLTLHTEDIMDYRRFCLCAMSTLNRFYAPMKPSDWSAVMAVALQDLVVEEVAPELTTTGQLLGHLTEYLTNRQKATKRSELAQGRPWCDEEGEFGWGGGPGDYYMSLDKFMEHLWKSEKGWRKPEVSVEIARPPISAVKLGQKTVARRSISLWRIPGGTVVREEPLEQPSSAEGVEKI